MVKTMQLASKQHAVVEMTIVACRGKRNGVEYALNIVSEPPTAMTVAEMSGGLGGPKPDKAAIGEILLALEAQNPTPSPATSALLNGKWKVLYATGASPGLKALTLLLKGVKQAPKSPSGAELIDVQDTFVTIQAEQPRVEAATAVRILSFENTAKLLCRLEPESAVRLLETRTRPPRPSSPPPSACRLARRRSSTSARCSCRTSMMSCSCCATWPAGSRASRRRPTPSPRR